MNRKRSDQAARRFALVTLVLPAAVMTVGLIVQLVALPQAPLRIPVFWDGLGAPSGWAPAWLSLVLTVVLGFGLPSVFGLSSLPSLRRGDRSPTFRIFGAQALGISVMLTVVTTCLLLHSVGPTSSDGSRVWPSVVVGLVAGVAAALAGWFLQPRGSHLAPARTVNAIELAPSERAAWMRMTYLPVPAVAVIIAAATIVTLKAGLEWTVGNHDGLAVILTVVALLLFAVLATTVAFPAVDPLPHEHPRLRRVDVRTAALVDLDACQVKLGFTLGLEPALLGLGVIGPAEVHSVSLACCDLVRADAAHGPRLWPTTDANLETNALAGHFARVLLDIDDSRFANLPSCFSIFFLSAATLLLPNLPLQELAMGVGGWEARAARGWLLISKKDARGIPLGVPALGRGERRVGQLRLLGDSYVIIALASEVN